MNLDSTKRLPFGFGIHPYFNALGMKKDILIRVPAKGYMPANRLIPTGKIVSMEEGPADLRGLTPLDKLDLDDLWWGMEPLKPMEIYYESIKRKVSIFASDIFTHAVTYTPAAQGFFCLENQTNATDAVRLYQDGHIMATVLSGGMVSMYLIPGSGSTLAIQEWLMEIGRAHV